MRIQIMMISFSMLLIFIFNMIYSKSRSPEFGHKWRSSFLLDIVNVNHGSYGSLPKAIMDRKIYHMQQIEKNPDNFLRYQSEIAIKRLTDKISELVSAQKTDIMIVFSASDAVNAFYKSIDWKKGDKVFFYNTVYGMTRKLFNYLKDRYEIELMECILTINDMQSDELIITKTKEFINKNGPFKAANLEHIGSIPSFVYPIKVLTTLFKSQNSLVLIDGAHAIGNIHINVTEYNADGYLSNLHKWMYSPRGTAFLHVTTEFQKILHPNIISHYYKTNLQKEFIISETMDYSTWLASLDAIKWREEIGEYFIKRYTNELAWKAGEKIASIWGTDQLIKEQNRIASMVNVRFYGNIKDDDLNFVMEDFKEKYGGTFLPLFKLENTVYCRVSGQIFNEVEDYEIVAKNFKEYYEKYYKF